MKVSPTGYCILMTGGDPATRIVFKETLDEVRKTISSTPRTRVEVLRMIDGDTQIKEEEEDNYEHSEG